MINPDAKPGKAARRRAISMETHNYEKRRGRVKRRVEALRASSMAVGSGVGGSAVGLSMHGSGLVGLSASHELTHSHLHSHPSHHAHHLTSLSEYASLNKASEGSLHSLMHSSSSGGSLASYNNKMANNNLSAGSASSLLSPSQTTVSLSNLCLAGGGNLGGGNGNDSVQNLLVASPGSSESGNVYDPFAESMAAVSGGGHFHPSATYSPSELSQQQQHQQFRARASSNASSTCSTSLNHHQIEIDAGGHQVSDRHHFIHENF